jgi:diguanylate cyclase (GGDEF)-like protein/PAS domain S-box-containing protein
MSALSEPEICRNILEGLPTGMCVIDMQKKIVFWSDGAERITGYLRHEVIGHSCVGEPLLHCDPPGCEFCSEECPLARAIETSHPAEATGFLHHKAGHEITVSTRAVPIHNERGSIIGAVETFENLQAAPSPDDRDAMRQSPDFTDAVTGLASWAMMLSNLQEMMAKYSKVQVLYAVLFFRVEGLTHFRASLGQEAASSLLRVIARTLESSLWITDFVGRWSDDQFLVILGGCREEAVGSVRERVRRTLAGESIEWWGERRSLPVSIGEASGQAEDTVELVLQRAQKSAEAAAAGS